jgi:hypothetical protein
MYWLQGHKRTVGERRATQRHPDVFALRNANAASEGRNKEEENHDTKGEVTI